MEAYAKGRKGARAQADGALLEAVREGLDLAALCEGGLDVISRERARLLLPVALEAEVADFLGRFPYERSGWQKGYRLRMAVDPSGQRDKEKLSRVQYHARRDSRFRRLRQDRKCHPLRLTASSPYTHLRVA